LLAPECPTLKIIFHVLGLISLISFSLKSSNIPWRLPLTMAFCVILDVREEKGLTGMLGWLPGQGLAFSG
jgi:hypothetical protein